MWFKNFTCSVGVVLLTLAGVFGQMYTDDDAPPVIIRSGLKAGFGYSTLYLSDIVRPFFTTSDNYSFTPDLCVRVGAMITVQPRFFGERFELVFDPAFTKFSYGNYKGVEHENYINRVDIDVETVDFPISLRYNFLSQAHILQPYIRAGYSYSFFVDTDAVFESIEVLDGNESIYRTVEFNYSKSQDDVFICVGLEFNFRIVDYTLELVAEKGDGIHKDKFGSNFMKISNTTTYYLQFGVLF